MTTPDFQGCPLYVVFLWRLIPFVLHFLCVPFPYGSYTIFNASPEAFCSPLPYSQREIMRDYLRKHLLMRFYQGESLKMAERIPKLPFERPGR